MRRGRQIGMVLLGAAVLALGSVRLGFAQTPDDANRGVARISLMDGQVSVKRGDAGEWVAGVINAPLMTGDHISTAPIPAPKWNSIPPTSFALAATPR